ncbi:MAG: hypothetical protein RPT00_00865, partial [Gammaproteobacteria bacterium]
MMNLGKIAAVTISTSDLNKMVEVYQEFLRYRVTKSGQITSKESSAWGAENLKNADYVVMQPEKSDDFSFRFIHQPYQSNYIAFKSVGWNAAELIVEDVDGLAVQLENSPFKIIGSPADLSFTKDIRAMQVMGPANEILYLTQFKNKVPEFDSPKPRCAVDQTFIVVLAGKSLDEMQGYFHANFKLPKATVIESRIRSISRVFNFPADTKYKAAALALKDQSMIELDELPKKGNNRLSLDGYLPAGIAMVSFLYYESSDKCK